jgi:hypothetical protein
VSVNLNPKSTGNRDKNSVFPMPPAIPQPVLDTSCNTVNPNVFLMAEHSKSTHPASTATPSFMPKCGTMPESGHDVADPNA